MAAKRKTKPAKKQSAKKPKATKKGSVASSVKANPLNKIKQLKPKQGAGQRIMLGLSIGLLIFAVAYFGRSLFVAATVNGKPISRLTLIRQLEQESGNMVMENLITKQLVLQEARRNNININESEIDREIDEIKISIEAQGTTLEDALAIEGKSMQHLRDAIEMDLVIEKLFGSEVNVTQEDARDYFDQNEMFFEGQTYEELEERIIDNLAKQEVYDNYNLWLTQAKADAQIKYFINF
jgi:hypothetical protein